MKLLSQMQYRTPAVLLVVMVVTFVFLIFRSAGIYPGVMGDEYTYSSMSRLMPLSSVVIPDYLYFMVYRLTNICGTGFLSCSRILNTLFFVASAPFIYIVARRLCGFSISILIVVLSMAGAINGYTVYFMPESMFFLFFWICLSFFVTISEVEGLKSWVIFGLLLGLTSLIKPHALFMVPAFSLCVAFFTSKANDAWMALACKRIATFICTMLGVKFAVSFVVAGKSGLTFFGNFYTSTFESSASTLQRYLDILISAPRIVEGHLLANALMFGAAIAVLSYGSFRSVCRKNLSPEDKIAFLAFFLLLNLIAVVGLFSASVAGTNATETEFRLHIRYYDFIFPLMYIAVGAQMRQSRTIGLRWPRLLIAISIVAMIAYAVATRMQPFTPSYIDGAELRGYTLNRLWFFVLAGMSATSVGLWWRSASMGALFYCAIYLPTYVIISTGYNNAEVVQRRSSDAYDQAGLFAKSYVPATELGRLVVIGDNTVSSLRSLVYIDNVQAGRDLSYVPGSVYTASQTAPDKKWILGVGDIKFAENEFDILQLNGFSLAKKVAGRYPFVMNFDSTSWPDSVTGVKGLSGAEAWGAWSDSPMVTIKFFKPLPTVFDLALKAKAFGPNINKPFNIIIGDQSVELTLSDVTTTQTLRIHNPDASNTLTIKIPDPKSPLSLRMSADDRALGIGLEQLEIKKID